MDVPNNYLIKDNRTLKDFKKKTISEYKKTDVVRAFQNSIINSKVEESCRWLVELHATGMINKIISSIEDVYIKYINIKNPYFLFYFNKKVKYLKKLLLKFSKKYEIMSRNNQEIRNLLVNLTCICALSPKHNIFIGKSIPSIKKNDFCRKVIKSKMISHDLDMIYNIVDHNDPSEIKLAINEIANLLKRKSSIQNILYWYIWLIRVTNIKKKKKDKTFFCTIQHSMDDIPEEYATEWIWPLWKIIMNSADYNDSKIASYIKILYKNYKINYKPSKKTKKQYYLFTAFYLLVGPIDWRTPMYFKEYISIQASCNINRLYRIIETNLVKKISEDGLKRRNIKLAEMIDNKNANIQKTQSTRGCKIKENVVSKTLIKKEIEKRKLDRCNRKMSVFMEIMPVKHKKNVTDYFKNSADYSNNIRKTIVYKKKK